MADKKNDSVYASLNYRGYIPELDLNGPIKGSFISKEKFRELVQKEYDVRLLNPAVCPEFAAQMEEYRAAVRNNEHAKAALIAARPFTGGVKSVADEISNKLKVGEFDNIAANAASAGSVVDDGVKAAINAINQGTDGVPAQAGENAYGDQMNVLNSADDAVNEKLDLSIPELPGTGAASPEFDASAPDMSGAPQFEDLGNPEIPENDTPETNENEATGSGIDAAVDNILNEPNSRNRRNHKK